MWVSQIQMPPTKNHRTFMNMFRQPGWGSLRVMWDPKGHRARMPSFMLCRPKGMPMMVIMRVSPPRKYSMAISRPPKRTQMMLPMVFMAADQMTTAVPLVATMSMELVSPMVS